mgnify:FL=1
MEDTYKAGYDKRYEIKLIIITSTKECKYAIRI